MFINYTHSLIFNDVYFQQLANRFLGNGNTWLLQANIG